jgi:apolipoprotein N-acyltransferase
MPYGHSGEGRFLPLICYEILDPEYVRDYVRSDGSDFLVNITQDRWYGKTIETFQHYELGRIRAVETRKAIVRSTNSGTSGMVDIAGNYARPLVGPVFTGQEVEAVQIFEVPVHRNGPTVFVRFGNQWMWIPALLFVLAFVARRFRRKR